MTNDLDERFYEYASIMKEMLEEEISIKNKKRLTEELRKELQSPDSDGSYGIEMTAHAFKNISERLETLALENTVIYNDVFNGGDKSLMFPSNMKVFIISLIAKAKKEKSVLKKSGSKGVEFHYTIEIDEWGDEKKLQFVAIVENNHIKTGYFNWI